MVSLLGKGVYSFPDAAKYTRLRTGRLREWFRSNTRQRVFLSDFDDKTENLLISFNDLIEVFIAGQLREHGAPLRWVRQAHKSLSEQWSVKHPFCRRELMVHNGRILYANLEDPQNKEIYDVLTKQRVFPDVLLPFMKRLNYDDATNAATKWDIADGVELNPAFCFGKPVASKSKKPTYLLSAAYEANGRSEDATARWYGVSTEDVRAAVKFEASLSA